VQGLKSTRGSNGATDNASDYGSEDSRFESWLDRNFLLHFSVEICFVGLIDDRDRLNWKRLSFSLSLWELLEFKRFDRRKGSEIFFFANFRNL
jgi:hypothetical protein